MSSKSLEFDHKLHQTLGKFDQSEFFSISLEFFHVTVLCKSSEFLCAAVVFGFKILSVVEIG